MNLKVTKFFLLVALFTWVPKWAHNYPATNSGTLLAYKNTKTSELTPNEIFNQFLKKTKEEKRGTMPVNTFPLGKNHSLEIEADYWVVVWNNEGNLDLTCSKMKPSFNPSVTNQYEKITTVAMFGVKIGVSQLGKFIK